jgi:protein involved in polysaccharide export with SLBB domain
MVLHYSEPRLWEGIVMKRCSMVQSCWRQLGNRARVRFPFVLALLSLSIMWGCASEIKVPPLTLADVSRMEAAANSTLQTYRIEPGDSLSIRYTFHPEMNQEELVRRDGKISAVLVGEVSVAGMTTAELTKYLVEQTSHRLRDPEVIVEVTRSSEKTIYVGGEVGRPGAVPYRDGLSPLQAILAAGGFRETARLDSVILVRAQGQENDLISRKINLEEVVVDGAKEQISLAPHDVVFVPRTAIANANIWVRQHITDLIPFARPRFPGY